MNQCTLFFVILIYCVLEPFPLLYCASKTFPIGNILSLVFLRNYLLLLTSRALWMFYLLKYNIWQKKIIIVLCTFNVYIRFLPFVYVSTCNIWLFLPISIINFLKKISNSIEGLLLLLLLLAQVNWFIGNNFNLSLWRMTICKVVSHNIFHVFRKGNKTWSVTCLT